MLKEETKMIDSAWLEGMSSISALIKGMESGKNSRRILRVLIDAAKQDKKHPEIGFLKAKAMEWGFSVELTDAASIAEIAIGNTHGGILAECTPRVLPEFSSDIIVDRGVYFMVEGIEDPYNFGYTVRSLYAAGVTGLIVGPRNWMGAAGVVARSSAGCSELMDIYMSDPLDAIQLLKSKNYQILCAGIRDSESLFQTDLSAPLCVVLGGEKRGVSRAVLEQVDRTVRIDYGTSFGGSLSTAASAAVFAFEILRYNRFRP